jgi:hypothetical protein
MLTGALLAVILVVHVPLRLNSGAPTPPATIARYEREFHALGTVVDHRGIGSWTPDGTSHLVFDNDDHAFITTTARRARAFLVAFLPRMRRELRQTATLGEILGGWYGTSAERRLRVTLALPQMCACAGLIRAIHLAFAPAGGDSEYDDRHGIHIYSSVPLDRADAVVATLRKLRLAPAVTRSTFILFGN